MTSLAASQNHPLSTLLLHRSMTRPCQSIDRRTSPSAQRGGGCFCNLATLSIFRIFAPLPSTPSLSHTLYFLSALLVSPLSSFDLVPFPLVFPHTLLLSIFSSSRPPSPSFIPTAVNSPLGEKYKQDWRACVLDEVYMRVRFAPFLLEEQFRLLFFWVL